MGKTDPKTVKNLVRFALLASLATLLQISAAIFPGPGHVLSAFNTLPICIAALISPRGGLFCYIIAAWLTLVIIPSEAPILVLCTGPLGLILGTGMYYCIKKPMIVLASAAALAAGMASLTFILGIPAFGGLFPMDRKIIVLTFFTTFSMAYSWAWYGLMEQVMRRLNHYGFQLK